MKHAIAFQKTLFIAGIIVLSCCLAGIAQVSSPDSSAAAPPSDTLAQTNQATPAAQTRALFDTIAGPLRERIKAKKTPYLVVGDIEVPVNKTVTIEPGVVFLFKNFTGMHVLGKLSAQGTKDAPIIFTSENDRSVNQATSLYPNPYDWNGIYIHADAVGTSMSFCKVLYSVYGIVSETKFIRLDPVILLFNGKSNLVIEGKPLPVADKPYSYVLSTKNLAAEGIPVKILADPAAPRRNTLRYVSLVIAMAATVGTVYYGTQWNNTQRDLTRMSTDDPSVLRQYDESEWISLRNRRTNSMYGTGIGGVAAILGFAGFTWSFTF